MSTRAFPSPSALAKHWRLNPEVVYLNHGSFGACPAEVLEAQSRYRAMMELEAVDFFTGRLEGLLDEARRSLAGFLNCGAGELALLPNATIAVATVLRNLKLRPGDEILVNDHEYPACRHNFQRAAEEAGATLVVASLPFPVRSEAELIEPILAKVTGRTRIALLSHVTSPTAIVLPVERLCAELEKRGVLTLVDGAHAPGFVPVDLGKMRPAFYTANCHKWICSPKGSAFLYVREDLREGFRPLALSNNAVSGRPGRDRFLVDFDYVGTQDYTAVIAIADALRHMAGLVEGGWPEIMRRNRTLALEARDLLCRELGVEPPVPDSMLGPMCTLILPPHEEARRERLMRRPTRYHDALWDRLRDEHRIETPIWGLAGRPHRFVRISAQLYNALGQYEYLAGALKAELARERTL